MGSTDAAPRPTPISAEPWITLRPTLDAMLAPLGELTLARLAPRRNDTVLDVGCGCGTTTLDLASAVGAGGRVTGIDIDAEMLAIAREEASAAEAANVTYVQGDAGVHPFAHQAYDGIYSRLGTMFFDDPVAAFTNLHRALRPGGRLAFVCWRPLAENRWVTEVRDATTANFPGSTDTTADLLSPFSQGDPDEVATTLTHAGFVDVEIEAHDEPLPVGRGDLDEAIDFYLQLLSTGYLHVEHDRHTIDRLKATVSTVLERHHDDDGIWMGSASWVITALR
ncbi:MAG: methyltransferase domain-containing protein [Actinomycetota bacterium]|nr:methyltransferase domain-containing protein [Actinomycetota bacterium]